MAEQTLDVRGGGFLEELERLEGLEELDSLERLEELERLEGLEELDSLERLEGLERLEVLEVLEVLEKLEAQQRAMAKHGRKRNNIARYSRAYTHTSQEFYVFCCHKCHTNSITHYVITVYIYFRNNIPHCHTFTLLLHPKKSPKHHPQNNFSISNLKQHVVFHKTTRCFP